MRRHEFPLTCAPHTILIFVASSALLALGIALLVLQVRVQDAFRDERLQYPSSSLAEFMFVPLSPVNIDLGPTMVKYAVGGCALAVSILGLVWPVLHWCRVNIVHIRMLGSAVCIAAVTNTVAVIGFTVYLFVREARGRLPDYFKQWGDKSFTQEFYVCEAVPSVFPNIDAVYGFPACEKSRTAKYAMLAVCCVSAILAGLSLLQADRDGVFAVFKQTKRRGPDVEQARPRAAHSHRTGLPKKPEMAHVPEKAHFKTPGKVHALSGYVSRSYTSLHGYYAKL